MLYHSSIILMLILVNFAEMIPWFSKRIAFEQPNEVDTSDERPTISISSVLRDPRHMPFSQLFSVSNWHGKVMNQIQGYNELFRDLDSDRGKRRKRLSRVKMQCNR